MEALVVAVVLGGAVLAGGFAQRRFRVPAPWVWVIVGAAVSFVPGLQRIEIPPEVVLFVFLPALLYWEALNTSLQLLRFDARSVGLLSVGLVGATAAAIAGLGVLAGLTLPVALVLGAVLSPTDATALAAQPQRLPRRIGGILRGESLVNDGSALSLYSVAVAAVVAGTSVSPWLISGRFVYAIVVGVVCGVAVGLLVYLLRRAADQPVMNDALSVLTPFALYLPAAALQGSGVVSVVTGGLLLARLMPRVVSAQSRNEGYSFWRATTYVVNGALFVLIGAQAHAIADEVLSSYGPTVVLLALACGVTVFVVRLLWILAQAPVIRALDRRPSQRSRREPLRNRMILAWGGFRGSVSLAAALALPVSIEDGSTFPDRGLIIAVTFVVIIVTLFAQGATLPAVVRAARANDRVRELAELRLSRTEPIRRALEHLEADAAEVGADAASIEYVRTSLEHELEQAEHPTDEVLHSARAKRKLLLSALRRRRHEVIKLRDERRIDDTVMLRAQEALDFEELQITANFQQTAALEQLQEERVDRGSAQERAEP